VIASMFLMKVGEKDLDGMRSGLGHLPYDRKARS
jgi:hypothetical protein